MHFGLVHAFCDESALAQAKLSSSRQRLIVRAPRWPLCLLASVLLTLALLSLSRFMRTLNARVVIGRLSLTGFAVGVKPIDWVIALCPVPLTVRGTQALQQLITEIGVELFNYSGFIGQSNFDLGSSGGPLAYMRNNVLVRYSGT